MAELPVREIFVGIIAESLAKDGYFGVEIDFYVFYAWEGEMRTYFLENEEECVRKMIDLAAKGICVSDYVLYKAHLLQDTAVMCNQALTCAEEKLAERESAAFAARVEKYEALGENLHEQEFKNI